MADTYEKAREYVNSIYEKISVATAIAVIRTKPQHLSIEEYIEALRSSILNPKEDKKCDSEIICTEKDEPDSEIICTEKDESDIPSQQTALFNKLLAVIPNENQGQTKDNESIENDDSDEDMEISQDLFGDEPVEKHADSESDGAEDADMNMRFIQAIVRLKSIINSRSSMSAKKLHNILGLFASSGYSDLELDPEKASIQNQNVSCCTLSYVMRSTETCDLLKFSLEKVFSYLNRSMNSSWWDADDDTSLIAHAIKTVKQLIELASTGNESMGVCLETCLKFLTDLVDEIYKGTGINKGEIWERYCTIIIEFCKCRYLCVNTIFHTMEIILSICEELKSFPKQEKKTENSCGCGPMFNPDRLENSWYLLYILKNLLTYSRKSQWENPKKSYNNAESNDIKKIRDLWKSSWKSSDSEAANVDREIYVPSLFSDATPKWKERLNHFIITLSQTYPLLTFDLYECEKLLP